jgi:hypothetical protein
METIVRILRPRAPSPEQISGPRLDHTYVICSRYMTSLDSIFSSVKWK